MSWANEQIVPAQDVVDTVFAGAIRPTIEVQMGRMRIDSLLIAVSVWQYDLLHWATEMRISLASYLPLHAELRLRFRSTFKSTRQLFFGQMRLAFPLVKIGYSGFSVRGAVKTDEEGKGIVAVDNVTTEYNMDHWCSP